MCRELSRRSFWVVSSQCEGEEGWLEPSLLRTGTGTATLEGNCPQNGSDETFAGWAWAGGAAKRMLLCPKNFKSSSRSCIF